MRMRQSHMNSLNMYTRFKKVNIRGTAIIYNNCCDSQVYEFFFIVISMQISYFGTIWLCV